MWSFIERAKKVIFALILSIIPLVLLYAQSRDEQLRSFFARPVIEVAGFIENGALGITGFVSDSLFRYFFLVDRADELLQLRAKALRTDSLQAQAAGLIKERGAILDLCFASKEMNIPRLEFANVVARAGAPMARMIRIDRGSNHGIRSKSPVVALEGVVGQVLSVAENFSDVLLVTDASSAIGVKIIESNARGLLRGATNNDEYLMEIRDIDGLLTISSEDVVVTSGVNSLFPAGIPVGKVTSSIRSADGIFVAAQIKPFVAIDKLDHVLVLLEEAVSASSKAELINAAWPLAAP